MYPDPYHGYPPRSAPPHAPGTTTRTTTRCAVRLQCDQWCHGPDTVHQASFGYRQRAKIPHCLKPPLFNGKMDLFILAIFVKKAYLILIGFQKSVIFDVFAKNSGFLTLFWTPLFFTVFHGFRGLRFSLGNLEI